MFFHDASKSTGYRAICKDCDRIQKRVYIDNNRERVRATQKNWRSKNQAKIKTGMKEWRLLNREYLLAKKKEDYKQNKEHYRDLMKKWYRANKLYVRTRMRAYQTRRCKTDLQYKLSRSLRTRMNLALRRKVKPGSTIKALGVPISDLIKYLETKFLPGMTWSNHGLKGWHIDHIKPLSSFDLTDPNQFKKAAHYTNLQPLWACDNIAKGSRSAAAQPGT
jgi:hypothetical protein